MRITLDLEDHLLQNAAELTGQSDESTLLRLGLEALIAQESARRLAGLGGTDPGASVAARSRPPLLVTSEGSGFPVVSLGRLVTNADVAAALDDH